MRALRALIPLTLSILLSLTSLAGAESSFDRELLVKADQTRADQAQAVLKELMAAYEDEDAQGFLALVSDERFRQDYITFTDALYSDFREYEIHHIEYWIDRVVSDHVKQFVYVRWEKRYEVLDDGRQLTTRGYSRFLFDDVEGDYLLVELAGNSLFGGSLPEWVEEVPQISGQEMVATASGLDPVDSLVPAMPADLVVESAVLTCPPLDMVLPTAMSPTVTCRVRNIGGTTSDPCQIILYLYKDTYTSSVQSLAAGQAQDITFTGVNSDSCPSGYLDDRVIVDYLDTVPESNESNNESSLSLGY